MHILSIFLFLNIFTPNAARADESDFLSVCKAHAPAQVANCESLHKLFFLNAKLKDPAVPFQPSQLKAPPLAVDGKVQFIAIQDPNYMPGAVYCYGVFKKWIDAKKVTPDMLGMGASGFSVLKENLAEYQAWLAKKEGAACRKRVEKESGVPITDLEASLKDHVALVAVNPLAAVMGAGPVYENILDDLKRTVNHERIHAYQVLCPEFEKWSLERWRVLDSRIKMKLKTDYSNYNWGDEKTAARESAAFKLEKDADKIAGMFPNCKIF